MPSIEDALAFYPPERRPEIAQMLQRVASHGESFDFESDFFTADGRARRVRSIGEPQLVDGRPVAVIGVFQDITERHAREQSLRQSADTDALTGLPNRACLDKRLAETMTRQADDGGYLLIARLRRVQGCQRHLRPTVCARSPRRAASRRGSAVTSSCCC